MKRLLKQHEPALYEKDGVMSRTPRLQDSQCSPSSAQALLTGTTFAYACLRGTGRYSTYNVAEDFIVPGTCSSFDHQQDGAHQEGSLPPHVERCGCCRCCDGGSLDRGQPKASARWLLRCRFRPGD